MYTELLAKFSGGDGDFLGGLMRLLGSGLGVSDIGRRLGFGPGIA
jgi:hypothetical protein